MRHPTEYPWQDVGDATVVDVGGGVGGFMMQLSQQFQPLKFVIQDYEKNVILARNEVWPREQPQALADGRVEFMAHDFFPPNPVRDAEVYWMRYILHDWADDYCIDILSNVRKSMSPDSRLLVCEQVMYATTDIGDSSVPSPLPANYGVERRWGHQRDLIMMGSINGIERTPEQFKTLFMLLVWFCTGSGLVVVRSLFWKLGLHHKGPSIVFTAGL